MTPRTVIRGDARHGVNRYARTVAAHLPAGDPGRAHVHFTDRLWGRSPEEAAARFERFAAGVPATVTLHDAPQPSDGPVSLGRRAAAYGRVAAAARAVACSSAHEATLLDRHVGAAAHVIAHYVERTPVTPGPTEPTVAILGFIYPGKGHAEVIDAVAALARQRRVSKGPGPLETLQSRSTIGVYKGPGPLEHAPGVVALGGPAEGHEGDVEALRRRARAAGVTLTVTGYLDDDALARRLATAGVPVAAHQHVSASGSIATWIGAGRRPLVPDGPYARELPEGTVTRYTDLAAALADALTGPRSTWRAPGVDPGPDPRATADAYRAWWAQVDW